VFVILDDIGDWKMFRIVTLRRLLLWTRKLVYNFRRLFIYEISQSQWRSAY